METHGKKRKLCDIGEHEHFKTIRTECEQEIAYVERTGKERITMKTILRNDSGYSTCSDIEDIEDDCDVIRPCDVNVSCAHSPPDCIDGQHSDWCQLRGRRSGLGTISSLFIVGLSPHLHHNTYMYPKSSDR